MTDRRYPYTNIAPLLTHLTARQVGDLIDVPLNTVQRWRSQPHATITQAHADGLASSIGVHPASIWPDWAADLEQECAADLCDITFVPSIFNPSQRFCSPRCYRRWWRTTDHARAVDAAWHRNKHRTNPEHRAQKLAATRRYHAAARSRKQAKATQ